MKKPLFNKIVIVGVGLIGGSLGLAIKKYGLAKRVIGFPHRIKNQEHLKLMRKAVDEISIDEEERDRHIKDAELIVLAMPVLTNLDWIKRKFSLVTDKTFVMDVGSTKKEIYNLAREYFNEGQFAGCHPMAGRHQKGVEYAEEVLFKDSMCFMTSRNKKIEALWEAVGAKPVVVTCEEHDEWVALVSHLPHIFAFTLLRMTNTARGNALSNSIGRLNPSFKELVRLSKSDPRNWADIFWSNRKEIVHKLDRFEKELAVLRVILRGKSFDKVHSQLRRFVSTANHNAHKLMPEEG